MLAILWQLDQTQWWPSERIVEHQFQQLRQLAAHAVAQVPYYRHALREAGLSSADELDPVSFRRWPVLKKSALRGNEAALHARSSPPSHGSAFESATTGSTGTPVRIRRTPMEAQFAAALFVREHLLHERNLELKLGTIRGGVTEGAQRGWGVANAAFETGPGCAISLSEPVQTLLKWLLREKPAYLLATPLVLRELVLLSRSEGVAPEGLIQAMTFGAMQPAGLRTLVQASWNVEVTDSYSCVEAGGVAVQCPGHGHYLVHAENVYCEVLRDDGSPCEPGEVGRVVITPLHNFAMPLIRYELGDYAEPGGPCPTGRGLPTLARIIGRTRNLLRDPGGGLRSPDLPPSPWLDAAIQQYRLVQHTLTGIEVQYVKDQDLSESQAARLVASLEASLRYPFDIRLRRVPEIARAKGDKFEEFVCLVDQSQE